MSSRQPTSDLTSKFTSQCPDDLIHPATYIIKHSEQHKVVAFYGQLGAGKTTLIKVICKMLGTEDVLSSPTFSIVNEYRLTGGNPIFHLDFYRIKSQQEALIWDMNSISSVTITALLNGQKKYPICYRQIV